MIVSKKLFKYQKISHSFFDRNGGKSKGIVAGDVPVPFFVSCNNASFISPGRRFKPSTISFSCERLIFPLTFPIEHIRSAKATNCVVKAFVLATPISGPA